MEESKTIIIGKHKVGVNYPPLIVAEMSGNHNQSLSRALSIIEAAAESGAHALKLQTYKADTMTLNLDRGEFFIKDPASLWKGKSLYQLYQHAYTPWEWHKSIFDRCRELEIEPFSTPFDSSAVDLLESLDTQVYKIASSENTDLPLIRRVASTGKPMIISTGMATVAELDETIRTARTAGCNDLILLKCTSTYPATPKEANILTIPHMRNLFNVEVGLSDHTIGIGVALAAVAHGATLVEKHFTISRADGGVDAAFSLEPFELKSLVLESHRVWQALGHVEYGPTENEQASLKYRCSLYIVEDMENGELLTKKNLRSIRPGLGLPPKYYETLLGKRVNKTIRKGTPTNWEMIG